MALQTKTLTANGAKGHHKFTLTVSENSTSVSGNTSALGFSFVLDPIQTSWNWAQWGTSISYTININGSTYSGYIPDYDGSSSVTLKSSNNLSVKHDSNGAKSISISFSVTDGAGKSYTCGNASSSGSMTLTTIPRTSTMSFKRFTMGSAGTITINRASNSFTHTLSYAFKNSETGAIATTGYIIKDTSSTSITWTPKIEDFAKYIPNATSGTGSLTLTTYYNGTEIGYTSQDMYMDLPSSVIPTIGKISLSPQTYSILVQNKNKLTISVSGCSAGTGSSIKSYTFSGPGISNPITQEGASYTVGPISTTDELIYRVTVTDSRGRTNYKESKIICYEYSVPKFTEFKAYRVDSNGNESENGTNIKCIYSTSHSLVNKTNNVSVKIYYKLSTASSYSSATIASSGGILTNSSGTKITFNVGSTYTVYATVTDSYDGSSPSSNITVFGASRILNITSDGTGVAFGKIAESKDLLESRYRVKAPGLLSARDGRTTTNINIVADDEHLGCLESFIVKSGSTGVPSLGDGHVAHFHWDNTGGWDSQLYLQNTTGAIMSRGCNGGTWGSWNAVEYKPTTLYTSNISSGNSGTVTLSQSAANFSYLEIFFQDNYTGSTRGYLQNSNKIYSPNGKTVELSIIEASTTSSTPRLNIRSSYYLISGTSITKKSSIYGVLADGVATMYQDGTSSSYTPSSYIRIVKVLGYK